MKRLVIVVVGLAIVVGLAVGLMAETEPGRAAFPGANGKIAFVSLLEDGWELFTINPDGTDKTRLTNNNPDPEGSEGTPSWSPDGTRLAFASGCEVVVANADGSEVTNLTNHPACDGSPSWSPDALNIAFDSNRAGGGGYQVYVMNSDGSGQVALTTGPDRSSLPRWSPDGSKIAFVRGQPSNWHIWVMNPDGSGQTRLSYAGNEETFPDWSPDGSKIVWESDHTIRVMNSDGTGVLTLTPGDTPKWSPDGSKIVFGSQPANDLLIMNPDGTDVAHIPNTGGGDSTHPDWQPLVAVGGIAELPALAGTSGSGMGGATYAVLAGAAAGVLGFAVLATLTVKRRRVRQ